MDTCASEHIPCVALPTRSSLQIPTPKSYEEILCFEFGTDVVISDEHLLSKDHFFTFKA